VEKLEELAAETRQTKAKNGKSADRKTILEECLFIASSQSLERLSLSMESKAKLKSRVKGRFLRFVREAASSCEK
jgi:hypothetical protein